MLGDLVLEAPEEFFDEPFHLAAGLGVTGGCRQMLNFQT